MREYNSGVMVIQRTAADLGGGITARSTGVLLDVERATA